MEVLFNHIQSRVLSHLSEAKSSISVAMAWFTNEEIFNQLLVQLEHKVVIDLIIINDGINNNPAGLPFDRFMAAGGRLFLASDEGKMHHKFAIIDNEVVLNGSYNWTYFAEHRNYENLTILRQPEAVAAFRAEFNSIAAALLEATEYKRSETFTVITQGGYRPLLAEDMVCRSQRQEALGNYARAISAARKAFELEPKKKVIATAISRLEQKAQPKGEGLFQVATANLKPRPDGADVAALLSTATKAYRKKDFKVALENLDRAILLDPDRAEFYFWSGLCLWRQGDYTDGIAKCDKALDCSPDYAMAWNLRGVLRYEARKLNDALQDFNKATLLNTHFAKAYYNRALLYRKTKATAKMKEDLVRCESLLGEQISKYPDDADAYALRGDVRRLLQRSIEADADYLKAKEIFDATDAEMRDENVKQRIKVVTPKG